LSTDNIMLPLASAPINESEMSSNSLISQGIEKILPVSSLFVLFMIIGGNFLAPLFPCKLQRMLTNNMYVKHILGLLTLIFFVELADATSRMSLGQTFASSFMLYVWFVLTTTMEAKVFMVLVVLFAVMYSLHIYLNQLDKEATPESIRLTSLLRKLEEYLYYFSIILTLFGVIAYYGRKKNELGTAFDLTKFFLGKPNCRNTSSKMGVMEGFRKAFA